MSKIDRFAPHIDITGFFGGKASKEKYNTYKNILNRKLPLQPACLGRLQGQD